MVTVFGRVNGLEIRIGLQVVFIRRNSDQYMGCRTHWEGSSSGRLKFSVTDGKHLMQAHALAVGHCLLN